MFFFWNILALSVGLVSHFSERDVWLKCKRIKLYLVIINACGLLERVEYLKTRSRTDSRRAIYRCLTAFAMQQIHVGWKRKYQEALGWSLPLLRCVCNFALPATISGVPREPWCCTAACNGWFPCRRWLATPHHRPSGRGFRCSATRTRVRYRQWVWVSLPRPVGSRQQNPIRPPVRRQTQRAQPFNHRLGGV